MTADAEIEPDTDELVLLMRALQDVNVPKFLDQDAPLFRGIIGDFDDDLERLAAKPLLPTSLGVSVAIGLVITVEEDLERVVRGDARVVVEEALGVDAVQRQAA